MPLFDPASAQGLTMRGDWYVFLVAAAVVAAIVYALILLPVILWRRREGVAAATFTGNPPLEIAYTIVPLLIVCGLFFVTYRTEVPVDHVDAAPQNSIDVTAFRWSWVFAYDGTPIVETGTPMEPPTLYLPVNRTTRVNLRSEDVAHSFWIPAFLFKRDAIPGMTNRFDLTPTREGDFLSKCAQFCGLDHALMSFQLKVVGDAAYDRFIASNGAAKP